MYTNYQIFGCIIFCTHDLYFPDVYKFQDIVSSTYIVLGSIPFGGAIFASYEILDYCFGQGRCLDGSDNLLVSFISGCVAGAAGQIASFPFDTIRRKMQVNIKENSI